MKSAWWSWRFGWNLLNLWTQTIKNDYRGNKFRSTQTLLLLSIC